MAGFNPYMMQPQFAQQQPQFVQQFPPQPQIQQASGLVSVRNEMEARNFPVGYGTSVTFKDETAPFIYTKTMGYSQLDAPRFEKYRLTKEEANLPDTATKEAEVVNSSSDELKAEIEALREEIQALKKQVEALKDE